MSTIICKCCQFSFSVCIALFFYFTVMTAVSSTLEYDNENPCLAPHDRESFKYFATISHRLFSFAFFYTYSLPNEWNFLPVLFVKSFYPKLVLYFFICFFFIIIAIWFFFFPTNVMIELSVVIILSYQKVIIKL